MGKIYRCLFLGWLVCFAAVSGFSQTEDRLMEAEFVRQLMRFHPRATQATLLKEEGRQEVLAARGLFDPVLGSSFYRKKYQQNIYYDKLDVGVHQPLTFLGMDLRAGLELNSGIFLNPERTTPTAGLAHAGLSIPLLQGMMIDERRTQLRLSKLYREQTNIEFVDMNNKLLLEGLDAYWKWNRARLRLNVLEEVLENNIVVFRGIKSSFLQGDRPAIDTVEAFQQLQRIELQYNTELVQYNKTLNGLQNYLFEAEATPVKLQSPIVASNFDESSIFGAEFIQLTQGEGLIELHPMIQLLRNERERLVTQLRWQKEQMKPRLDLHYNFLVNAGMSPLEQSLISDNYQVALNFSFPLLFRTARAKTRQFEIYENQTLLQLSDELNFLENTLDANRFTFNNLTEQVNLAENITSATRRLYDAELRRFRLGESSVFLVNTRELQYLQAQNALIDLKTEQILQAYRMLFDLGALYNFMDNTLGLN